MLGICSLNIFGRYHVGLNRQYHLDNFNSLYFMKLSAIITHSKRIIYCTWSSSQIPNLATVYKKFKHLAWVIISGIQLKSLESIFLERTFCGLINEDVLYIVCTVFHGLFLKLHYNYFNNLATYYFPGINSHLKVIGLRLYLRLSSPPGCSLILRYTKGCRQNFLVNQLVPISFPFHSIWTKLLGSSCSFPTSAV